LAVLSSRLGSPASPAECPEAKLERMHKALEGGFALCSDKGVADGIRTRDHRDHNPGLYQLSYRHREPTKDTATSLLFRCAPVGPADER
jgi:hypothetical protein